MALRCQSRLLPAWVSAVALLAGCADTPSKPTVKEESSPSTSSRFNPATAGCISGRVIWTGPIPETKPFEGWSNPVVENGTRDRLVQPNVNAPLINPESRGVGNAVLYLRGVDIEQAKPWDQPPVQVELRDYRFHLLQGSLDSSIGFVRRGDFLTMVSRQAVFHSIHADGSAFFSLTFPDPDRPLARRLERTGLVELASAAGYFWMRAYVFVDDHPYYARTDSKGFFRLDQVPAGQYDLVCWMPNWIEDHHERDPESSLIIRHFFKPPETKVKQVTVSAGKTSEALFTVTPSAFSP
jgi:hypothetical protein